MIEVSLSQLRAFIEAQPADRTQNMNEGGRHSPHGSFLIHYGLAQNWDFNFMIYDKWVRYHKQDNPQTIARLKGKSQWLSLFKRGADLGKTYGDLQRALL